MHHHRAFKKKHIIKLHVSCFGKDQCVIKPTLVIFSTSLPAKTKTYLDLLESPRLKIENILLRGKPSIDSNCMRGFSSR